MCCLSSFRRPDVAGIVDAIASPLAASGVPVLYVSTFSTDIFLVEESRLQDARIALEQTIFEFVDTATMKKLTRSISSIGAAVGFTPDYLNGGRPAAAKQTSVVNANEEKEKQAKRKNFF